MMRKYNCRCNNILHQQANRSDFRQNIATIISLCVIAVSLSWTDMGHCHNSKTILSFFVSGFAATRRLTTKTKQKQHQHSRYDHHNTITTSTTILITNTRSSTASASVLFAKKQQQISKERRKKLGILDTEDEYDLEMALDASTDPLITKIIAGSFIVTIIALLVVGVIIPLTTTYDDGICSPILNGGRCY